MSAIAKVPSRIDLELIREAFEHAPVGIAVVTPDGVLRLVNRALCQMIGYPRAALEGQPYRNFVPAADVPADEEHLRGIRAGGEPPESVDTRFV
ncbi:MAG: PAS domain-containing protein, partial [Usitatibacter sp.]